MKSTGLQKRIFSGLSLGLASVILLLFQNCSQVRFAVENGSDLLKQHNNGAGYGGKPDGDFYRFTPGFTCENKESFVSQIHATNNAILLTENKKFQCAALQQTLDPNLVDASIFQNDIIGYQEGIFEAASEAPTKIPANLVEVWCRDSKDWSGIETITHFDHQTNLAVNRSFYATADASGEYTVQIIPDFSVSRVIDPKTVTIKDGQDFELIVYRDQPDVQLGLFKGHLQSRIDGKLVSRNTSCRLAGTLDAKVWPVKQMADVNVLYFKQSTDHTYVSYASGTGLPAGQEALYTASSDGSRQAQISQGLSWANQNFQFTSDSKKLIYMLDGDGSSTTASLMSISVDGSNKTVITNSSRTSSAYLLSGDGQRIIYNSGDVTAPALRSVALDGTGSLDLHPPLSPTATGTFNPDKQQTHVSDNFDVSAIGNLVAFNCCFSMMNLYVTKADGTGLLQIPVSIPSGSTLLGVKFANSNSNKLIKAYAWSDPQQRPITYLTFLVNTDGSGVIAVPTGWTLGEVSPSNEVGVISNDANPLQRSLLSFKSGLTVPLPALVPNTQSFFTRDSSGYVGFISNASGSGVRPIKISALDGSTHDICTGVGGSSIQEGSANSFVLLAETATTLQVYMSQPEKGCRLVNSVPVSRPSDGTPLKFKISADGEKILGLRQNQLFYIPLNGAPSLKVNMPVFDAATITDFDFGGNSKSVIYRGDQIQPGNSNIFVWSAP